MVLAVVIITGMSKQNAADHRRTSNATRYMLSALPYARNLAKTLVLRKIIEIVATKCQFLRATAYML